MDSKTKVLAVLMAAIVAVSSFAFLPSILADESVPEVTTQPNGQLKALRWVRYRGLAWIWYTLKNGSPQDIEGSVEVVKPHILMIQVDGKSVTIAIPARWVVGDKVYLTNELFKTEPFEVGATASIKTITAVKEFNGYKIRIHIGYEITIGEVTAKALLPYNIETS